jgi:serine/threonine-protein kinase HipA
MKNKRCLYCYQPIGKEGYYHPSCSRDFFGSEIPPVLDYTLQDMEDLAREIVIKSVAVTGVQPKLSLSIEHPAGDPKNSRFTLVGLWGEYILKPPTKEFPNLPGNEDLTMHLCYIGGVATASHSLIPLKSGELAYITKRFDRGNGKKIAVEDMCQLTETLTEDKYKSSMEKVGKYLRKYSAVAGFDAIRLFYLSILCYLTGNADMHLKNFSLVYNDDADIMLSLAYDLVNTKLAMPSDKEETALTLNGKKAKLQRNDFDVFAKSLKIPDKVVNNTYIEISQNIPEMLNFIDISFLPSAEKKRYTSILVERAATIEMSW